MAFVKHPALPRDDGLWGAARFDPVTALVATTAVSAGASIYGAKKQASAAKRAAATQAAAGQAIRADLAPWREVGGAATAELSALMGLPTDTGPLIDQQGNPLPEDYYSQENAIARFRESPDYQFRFGEGQRALESSAAARGDLFSGNTGRALTEYGQGMASTEYGNYVNRLFSLSGAGANAAAQTGNAGLQVANNIAGAQMAGGQARADMFAGVSNAITGGVENKLFLDAMNQRGGINWWGPRVG